VVEHMRRPKRAGDVAAAAFELGGEAAVEDADLREIDGVARSHRTIFKVGALSLVHSRG